jgi:hypothetical protein
MEIAFCHTFALLKELDFSIFYNRGCGKKRATLKSGKRQKEN